MNREERKKKVDALREKVRQVFGRSDITTPPRGGADAEPKYSPLEKKPEAGQSSAFNGEDESGHEHRQYKKFEKNGENATENESSSIRSKNDAVGEMLAQKEAEALNADASGSIVHRRYLVKEEESEKATPPVEEFKRRYAQVEQSAKKRAEERAAQNAGKPKETTLKAGQSAAESNKPSEKPEALSVESLFPSDATKPTDEKKAAEKKPAEDSLEALFEEIAEEKPKDKNSGKKPEKKKKPEDEDDELAKMMKELGG